MAHVVVVGSSLPGVAAAARLAKAGHRVTLVEQRDHLGGRLAVEGAWAPLFNFPAPLRDLFRKSGRAFDPEFGRRGLHMVAAPPPTHVFPDGTSWSWPTDRGAQWHFLQQETSASVATRWRDLIDEADETWQLLRPLGLEGELVDASQISSRRDELRPRQPLEALAREVGDPRLAALVREPAFRAGSSPATTPSLLVSRLSVERTFGRWMLVDDDGHVATMTTVWQALDERLRTRGVDVQTSTTVTQIDQRGVRTQLGALEADAVVSALNPWSHAALLAPGRLAQKARWAAFRLRPALAPRLSVTFKAEVDEASEVVRHTPTGPIVTYTLPTAEGSVEIVHDHAHPVPDRGYGAAWRGAGSWLRRPGVHTSASRLFVASAAGRGGNEPWAQLLTGALATYAAHEQLTGEDIRPSNRDYRP